MIANRLFRSSTLLLAALAAGIACGSDDSTTTPTPATGSIVLTAAAVTSLDSAARLIAQANPGNPELKALVDSTLLVLTTGVEAKRVDIVTGVTTAPLYWVGVHRAFVRASGSSSTWSLVGFDDPNHLTALVEVSGFAQSANATAPASVNGSIGTGFVNALMLRVATGGTVTEWRAGSGSASFVSDAAGAACPNFAATAIVTCAMETMHVHFAANATGGSNGAGAQQASLSADTAIPAMRLTYTLP